MRSSVLPLAMLSLVLGACDRSGGQQPSASASASESAVVMPKPRLVCFDLPGAVRTALAVGVDGKHLFYAERVIDGDRDRYDLVSLDLTTRKTEVLVRDVGEAPERSGAHVVFLRPMDPPERSVAFPESAMESTPSRLWSMLPGRNEPVALSPEGVRVTSFVADPKGETVYYTGREPGAARSSIWKVPVAGGAPVSLGQGNAVFGFADGGKSLVITAFRDKVVLAKIPLAGGEPAWTAESGFNASITDTSVVLLGGPADKRSVMAISLADGKVAAVEGTQANDLPIVAGAPGYVVRDEGGGRALLHVEGGKLVPVVTITGGSVHAAAPLPDGMVATLVSIDTNGDGKVDDVIVDGSDDERDVCLLLPRSAGDEAPRAIPSRAVPGRHEAAVRKIKKLLEEKEPELSPGKLRFVASGRLLVIDAPGAGPTDVEALRERLKALQKGVGEVSGDPKLGVSIRFADSGRHATSLWSEERGRFGTWVGVGEFALADRAGAVLEYTVDYPRTVRVELGAVRKVSADVACEGKVKNIGSEPLDLLIDCRAYSPYTFKAEPWTTERAPEQPTLRPNASGSYKIKLPTLIDGNARPSVRFLVNQKPIDVIDTKEEAHDKDWIAALERIRAETGAAPVVDRPYVARTIESNERHPLAAFREPPNFAESSPKQQELFAKVVWKLVQMHAKKHDGGQTPSIALYDAKGNRTFTIDDGKLTKK